MKKKIIEVGDLVPDAEFRREIGGLSKMSVWRRDHGHKTPLRWPARIEVNGRFFRSRRQIEDYKQTLLTQANSQFKERVATRKRRGYRVTVDP